MITDRVGVFVCVCVCDLNVEEDEWKYRPTCGAKFGGIELSLDRFNMPSMTSGRKLFTVE